MAQQQEMRSLPQCNILAMVGEINEARIKTEPSLDQEMKYLCHFSSRFNL